MSDAVQPTQAQGPGMRLSAARQRIGVGLAQMAERLHLDPAALEALEADRYEVLGAPVYARGHLRRYAELLGDSTQEIDALYTARQDMGCMPDLTRVPVQLLRSRAREPGFRFWPVAVLAVLLALASMVWWALRVVPGAAAHRHVVTPVVAAAGQASPPAPAVAASTVTLTLQFRESGWAEVYDAHGARLFYDRGTAGMRRQMNGTAPLQLVLDNPGGVEIDLNGKPVALGDHLPKTLRFMLDHSGRVSERR